VNVPACCCGASKAASTLLDPLYPGNGAAMTASRFMEESLEDTQSQWARYQRPMHSWVNALVLAAQRVCRRHYTSDCCWQDGRRRHWAGRTVRRGPKSCPAQTRSAVREGNIVIVDDRRVDTVVTSVVSPMMCRRRLRVPYDKPMPLPSCRPLDSPQIPTICTSVFAGSRYEGAESTIPACIR